MSRGRLEDRNSKDAANSAHAENPWIFFFSTGERVRAAGRYFSRPWKTRIRQLKIGQIEATSPENLDFAGESGGLPLWGSTG